MMVHIEENKRVHRRLCRMILMTCLCMMITILYYQFNTQHSIYITYLFAIPLVGGIGVELLFCLLRAPEPQRGAERLYQSGILILILGSLLKGHGEIVAQTVSYAGQTIVVGAVMILLAGVVYLWHVIRPLCF